MFSVVVESWVCWAAPSFESVRAATVADGLIAGIRKNIELGVMRISTGRPARSIAVMTKELGTMFTS